jgi:hypothetical protein
MSQHYTWGDPAVTTQRDDRRRPLPSAQCSLCGITLPLGLMVPDGGRACLDIRWYCQDTKSCTERWTARPPRTARLAHREGTAAAREPWPSPEPRAAGLPEPVPAELLGGAADEA